MRPSGAPRQPRRRVESNGPLASMLSGLARWPYRPSRPPRRITSRLAHSRELVEVLDEGERTVVHAVDLRVGAFDHVDLVGRVGAGAVAHAVVAGGQFQRRAGEDVARPRAGAARVERRGIAELGIERDLALDQRALLVGLVRVVAARGIELDVGEAVLVEMGAQLLARFVVGLVRHEAAIDLGDGLAGQDGLAAGTGVAGD